MTTFPVGADASYEETDEMVDAIDPSIVYARPLNTSVLDTAQSDSDSDGKLKDEAA